MRKFIAALFILCLAYPACKVPEGMIAANFDTFEIDVNLNYLAHDMIKSLSQENKHKIAIVEFPDLYGNVSEFGKYVAEELTTRLFTTRRFQVVERQLLNQILAEQNLGLSGLVDPSSAARIGKLIGVDAIVTGTITDLGSSVRINARMIAVETASVFAVSSVSIEQDEKVRTMIARGNNTRPVSPNPVNESSETPKPVVKFPSTIAEAFNIEVKSCKLITGNRVRIEMIITNESKTDREISLLRNNTIFYDNFGNEYTSDYREIANKRESRPAMIHLLIRDIPVHMALEFGQVRSDVSNIPLLNIYFWTAGTGFFTASIRNISIEQ